MKTRAMLLVTALTVCSFGNAIRCDGVYGQSEPEKAGPCATLLERRREDSAASFQRRSESAPELELKMSSGEAPKPMLEYPGIFRALSLNSARNKDGLTGDWQRLADRRIWIVNANETAAKDLPLGLSRLSDMELQHGLRMIASFHQDGYRDRIRDLPLAGRVVVTSHESLKEVHGGGETFYPWLQSQSQEGASGDGSVHVLLGHQAPGQRTIQDYIAAAKTGRFRGQHVVVGICNIDPGAMYEFVKIAIANGARSVVASNAPIDVPAFSFAVHLLLRQGRLRVSDLPVDGWRACYVEALRMLETCLQDPNPREAVQNAFGANAEWLFPDGKLHPKRVDDLRNRLRDDPRTFNQFVDDSPRARRPLRRTPSDRSETA